MAGINSNRPMPFLSQEDIDRFWSKVLKSDVPDACWEWIGTMSPTGYGIFRSRTPRLNVFPHRLAVFLETGRDPLEMMCLHRCDNRACVRPSHIFLGTRAHNQLDMKIKGRAAYGDRHGSRTHPDSLTHGERNGQARLTDELVMEIRKAYDSGELTNCSALGRRFGISGRNARRIANRERWRHLP